MTALLDTGFVLALLSPNDNRHEACRRVMQVERSPLLPQIVLPELAYMVVRNLGYPPFLSFMRFALAGQPPLVEATAEDLSRAMDIMEQYADSKIDFVDCMVVAMAERMNITRVLTIDRRHFSLVRPRHTMGFEILP
jgi:uncharacterized protein